MAPSDRIGVCKLLLAEQKSFPHSKGDGRYGGSGLDERREQAIDVVEVQLYRKREEKLKAKIFPPYRDETLGTPGLLSTPMLPLPVDCQNNSKLKVTGEKLVALST